MAEGTRLAKAYVQIVPTTKGILNNLKNELGGEASKAGDHAGKVAGTSLASKLKGVVAAAGIATALKSALTEGAAMQQSLGGIETLFKDSADKVIANAKNAYLTAGMSANDYMESVTSFSASLLQGLAGDTNKAADVADMALTDMSDNANKMGTSMELIQNAYQGFAKQNYTMLDNLKLGYGGTKTEMQRLLADAQKLTGVKYDLNNLSDVYEAIHVIQTDLGITGTTALEASSTFSGSFASMKAALSNFMANLTLGEDIKPALESLISTTGTFLFDNLFPMVGNIVSGLAGYIADVAMNTDWISVIQNVLGVVRDVLSNGLTTYFGVDSGMIDKAFGFLIEGVPIVAENMQIAFGALCDGLKVIWDSIGQPIWDAIAFAITEVQGIFAQYMPAIMMFVQTAITGIKDSWENHLKPCFEAIGGFLNTVLVPLFQFVFDAIIRPLIQNTFEYIRNLWNDTLKPVFDNICDFLTNVFTGNWSEAFQNILNIVTAIFDGICNKISSKMEFAKDVINNAINKIKGFFNFDWSLPKLKMPHPRISGSFSLNPPSVPTFGIDWYAKAMNDPMIMNSPTAFGINSLGQIMAGGEAGSEVVSGTDTLMRMIAQAVASQNTEILSVLVKILEAIINLDESMSDNMRDGLSGVSLNVNNREFARLARMVN